MSQVGEYLDSISYRSEKTQRYYKKVLFQFLSFVDGDEKQLNLQNAQNFLKQCSKRGIENISIVTYTYAIRSFLKFVGLPDKEIDQIRAPRVGFKMKYAIDEEYWDRFLLQPNNPRDLVIAYCLLYGACRVGELRRIQVKNIDKELNMIIIRGMRDAKIRGPIQINQDTMDIIQDYIKFAKLSKDDYLVPLSERRIEQLVKKWAIQADVPHAKDTTPHSLRRSLGKAFYYKTGKDIEKTRIMLGHSNISSTQHYLSVSEEEVRDDYKKIFG